MVWPVATYGCKAWTLKKKEETRIKVFENKRIRRMMRISWIKMMTNERVYELADAKSVRLQHVRSLMTSLVEGKRSRGRPRISWIDNILMWTGLTGTALMNAVCRCWAALVLYCIVSIHLYSASCSAYQSEALPVRETQRDESSLERTKRGTWLTS